MHWTNTGCKLWYRCMYTLPSKYLSYILKFMFVLGSHHSIKLWQYVQNEHFKLILIS
jgi:hypothetical protein